MSQLIKQIMKLWRNERKEVEPRQGYEVVPIPTDLPKTNMFIVIATNKPKI